MEDHDLAFGDFEGLLPEGEYGAGLVRIWDRGTYDWQQWKDEEIVFTVHGGQTTRRFNLIRFKRGKPNKWLIIKVVVWATLVVRSAADKNAIPGPRCR